MELGPFDFSKESSAPRQRIMGAAATRPGIHFRELQRVVRLANGSLQYHLDVLTKKGLLRRLKQGGYSRFFPYWFPAGGMNLAGMLDNLPTRGIAQFLLENPWSSQAQIAKALSLSSSTVRWHLDRLEAFGAVEGMSGAHERNYNLRNPIETRKIVDTRKISSAQRMTGNFTSLWDL